MTKTVKISGMMCMNCVKRVEGALGSLPGVSVKVDLDNKEAVLTSEKDIDNTAVKKAVEDLGFEVTEIL